MRSASAAADVDVDDEGEGEVGIWEADAQDNEEGVGDVRELSRSALTPSFLVGAGRRSTFLLL